MEIVSPETKQRFVTALKDVGVANPHEIPVKQMNKLWAYFLSSFTNSGIFINEHSQEYTSDYQQEFNAYHEAAHVKHNHFFNLMAKRITPIIGAGLITKYAIKKTHNLWRFWQDDKTCQWPYGFK